MNYIYLYEFQNFNLKIAIIEKNTEFFITKIELDKTKNLKNSSPPKNLIKFIKIIDNYFDFYFYQKKIIKHPQFLLFGTDFQKKIWKTIYNIPFGKTISYQELAIKAGFKNNYSRAVGNACRKNRIPILIPCHRVLGKNQELKDYAFGVEIKKWLLEHEGSTFKE